MATESIFLRQDIHQLAQNCILMRHNHQQRKVFSLSVQSQRRYTQPTHNRSQEKTNTPRKKIKEGQQRKGDKQSRRRSHVTDGFHSLKRGSGGNYVSAGNFTQFCTTIAVEAKTAVEKPTAEQLSLNKNGDTEEQPLFKSIFRRISKHSRAKLKKQTRPAGPLQPKNMSSAHLVYWINEVILENCKQQFDPTIQLSAAKKYLIDRGSLLARGVPENQIGRIYQSLYVYSAGFSQFLKTIQGISQNVYISIWKVYSILLQSFSGGSLDTIINNLIQEKDQLVKDYEAQLDRQQEQIDRNEELNQKRNSQIYKEYQAMKDQTNQLELQKELITSDFMEAQKSFSDQIGLRLLFENKIGSLHHAYRQLMEKYGKMFKDLKNTNEQLQAARQQMKSRNQELIVLRQLKTENKAELWEMKQHVTNLERQLGSKREINYRQSSTALNWNTYRNQLITQNSELKSTVHQLTQKMLNTQTSLQLTTQSLKAMQKDYYLCLEVNKKQLKTIQYQNEVNNRYISVKKNKQQEQYEIELAMLALKVEEREEKIEKGKSSYGELEEQLRIVRQEKEILRERMGQKQSELKTALNAIETYKLAQNHNSQMLLAHETHIQSYLSLLSQKQKICQNLTKQIKALQTELTTIQQQCLKQQSDHSILKTTLATTKTKHVTHQLALDAQLNSSKAEVKQLTKQLQEAQKMMLSYRESSINLSYQLHNQKFERRTLSISYQHSLTVLESHAEQMKTLKKKIGEYDDRFEKQERDIKIQRRKIENERKRLDQQRRKEDGRVRSLQQEIKDRKEYVHPMLCEDFHSLCKRQQEQIQMKKSQICQLNHIHSETQAKLKLQLQRLELHIHTLTATLEKQRSQNEISLQYEQQKRQNLAHEIEQKQQQIIRYHIREKNLERQSKDKESRLMQMVKQKQARVEELMYELEKIQDQFYALLDQNRLQKIQYQEQLQALQRKNESVLSQLKSSQQQQQPERIPYFEVDEAEMKVLIRQGSRKQSIYQLSQQIEQNKSDSKLTRKRNNSIMMESSLGMQKMGKIKDKEELVRLMSANKMTVEEKEELHDIQLEDDKQKQEKQEQKKQLPPLLEQSQWRKDLGCKMKFALDYYSSQF